MSMPLDSSIWYVRVANSWPPSGAVHPPISPSAFEVLRTCRLRATFQRSHGYPRRSSPYARLGIAFHRCRELMGGTLTTADSPKAARSAAVAFFRAEVAKQKQNALDSSRDARRPWPGDLQQQMEISLALLAGQQFENLRTYASLAAGPPEAAPESVQEETLTSPDGLITGRPDLVDETPAGPVIVDYKTGSLSDPESLSRHERQCLLYAWLWHACKGVWPLEYRLINDVHHQEHRSPVDRALANNLAKEAAELILAVSSNTVFALEPSVGAACAWCDYRPWCAPFWKRGAVPFFSSASDNYERLSIEGVVTRVQPSGAANLTIHLWAEGADPALDVPVDRFQHLHAMSPGESLRVLDAVPLTSDRSWFKLDAWSEVFIVVV